MTAEPLPTDTPWPYEPEVLTLGPTYLGLRLVRDDGADEVHAIPVAAPAVAVQEVE